MALKLTSKPIKSSASDVNTKNVMQRSLPSGVNRLSYEIESTEPGGKSYKIPLGSLDMDYMGAVRKTYDGDVGKIGAFVDQTLSALKETGKNIQNAADTDPSFILPFVPKRATPVTNPIDGDFVVYNSILNDPVLSGIVGRPGIKMGLQRAFNSTDLPLTFELYQQYAPYFVAAGQHPRRLVNFINKAVSDKSFTSRLRGSNNSYAVDNEALDIALSDLLRDIFGSVSPTKGASFVKENFPQEDISENTHRILRSLHENFPDEEVSVSYAHPQIEFIPQGTSGHYALKPRSLSGKSNVGRANGVFLGSDYASPFIFNRIFTPDIINIVNGYYDADGNPVPDPPFVPSIRSALTFTNGKKTVGDVLRYPESATPMELAQSLSYFLTGNPGNAYTQAGNLQTDILPFTVLDTSPVGADNYPLYFHYKNAVDRVKKDYVKSLYRLRTSQQLDNPSDE